MKFNCPYCYQPIPDELRFHPKCSMSFFGTPQPPLLEYSIDQMAQLAKQVVERSISVPGVQPKLSMTLIKKAMEGSASRLTVVGALGGGYILKPPSDRFLEMPENEHLTMRIAEAMGIRVVPSSLIPLASGEFAYITRRIDRTATGDKWHMLDMFQITEAVDKYKSSMEKVGRALGLYSSNTLLDLTYLFDLLLFIYVTGNSDMHLKNFSMMESSTGWVSAPAYDLLNVAIVLPEDREELALTLAGKKRRLRKEDFVTYGQELGLTAVQVKRAFERLEEGRLIARQWIQQSFLSDRLKEAYSSVMDLRYSQLGM